MEKEAYLIEKGNEVKKSQRSWLKTLCIIAIPSCIILLLITPACFGSLNEIGRATFNLKQTSLYLLKYEAENGQYPKRLEDLVSSEVMYQQSFDDYFARRPKMSGVWWYNEGIAEKGSSAPPETPHMISPSIKGKRVILQVDLSVKEMTDEEAMKAIAEAGSTWKPLWASKRPINHQ